MRNVEELEEAMHTVRSSDGTTIARRCADAFAGVAVGAIDSDPASRSDNGPRAADFDATSFETWSV